jgi:hypothetical protein
MWVGCYPCIMLQLPQYNQYGDWHDGGNNKGGGKYLLYSSQKKKKISQFTVTGNLFLAGPFRMILMVVCFDLAMGNSILAGPLFRILRFFQIFSEFFGLFRMILIMFGCLDLVTKWVQSRLRSR